MEPVQIDVPSLVIIQNRETQFDAPLYALIHQRRLFPFQVIYTTPVTSKSSRDCELGFAPQWNHLISSSYPRRDLSSGDPLTILRLVLELKKQRPALVLICGYFPRSQLLLAVLLRLLGQRIGIRTDNTLIHSSLRGWRGKLRAVVVGFIQRLFQSWHPVGQQAYEYLSELSGADRPTFRFAYAVDNDWFSAASLSSASERSSFKAQLGWPDDAFVVLGILKWHEREDPLTLIRAFTLLQARFSSVRMILVGDGPLRCEVQAAIAPLGATIHCPGYQPYSALPRWYAMADVFVHPSPDEPWGVSVNEAMACGLPVVATSGVGAAHELISDGINGRIVPNRDPQALADALAELPLDPTLCRLWGKRCRSVASQWSYTQTINALQQAMLCA